MRTPPFYKEYHFVSILSAEQVMGKLTKLFVVHESKDGTALRGTIYCSTFRFHRIIAWGSKNSFNPIFYGEIISRPDKPTQLYIKIRIGYPVYVLWIIIFLMTVFGHITLTYGSFQTDGLPGVFFAAIVMAIFYAAHYLFYRLGFKRNVDKTISLLIADLKLTQNESANP